MSDFAARVAAAAEQAECAPARRSVSPRPAGGCASCGAPLPPVSVVIASHMEGRQLADTIASVRSAMPAAEIVAVDDASPVPEAAATMRLRERRGCSGARRAGIETASGDVVVVMDAHMRANRAALAIAVRLAHAHGAIASVGCNGHRLARLVAEAGVPRCKWAPYDAGVRVVASTGMMGACYAIRRDLLAAMGGWPALPAPWGADEEFLSLQAAKCGVPIWAVVAAENWHLFRSAQPYYVPPWSFGLNIAATCGMLLERRTAERVIRRVARRGVDGVRVPPDAARALDLDRLAEAGAPYRAAHVLSDADLMDAIPELTL